MRKLARALLTIMVAGFLEMMQVLVAIVAFLFFVFILPLVLAPGPAAPLFGIPAYLGWFSLWYFWPAVVLSVILGLGAFGGYMLYLEQATSGRRGP